eukprot:1683691-Prymnesium_polylepis.2
MPIIAMKTTSRCDSVTVHGQVCSSSRTASCFRAFILYIYEHTPRFTLHCYHTEPNRTASNEERRFVATRSDVHSACVECPNTQGLNASSHHLVAIEALGPRPGLASS